MAGYVAQAGAVTAAVVLAGWFVLDREGRNGLLLAGGTVMLAQTLAFAALASAEPGSNRFLGIWIAGTVARMVVVGGVGWALEGVRAVDPVVALLTMAGLFFALILLELRVMRDPA